MAVYTTKWTSKSGDHSVTTTREHSESPDQHAARHAAEVYALQLLYPPLP